jgi:Fe-S-cluster-containing dehydrogenase component
MLHGNGDSNSANHPRRRHSQLVEGVVGSKTVEREAAESQCNRCSGAICCAICAGHAVTVT